MKRHACLVLLGDAGDECVAVGLLACIDEVCHQCRAGMVPGGMGVQIDGYLPCVGVGGAFFPGVGIAISDYFSVLLIHEVGVVGRDAFDALCHFRHFQRFRFKGDGRVEDVVVVDACDAFGVTRVDGSDHSLTV